MQSHPKKILFLASLLSGLVPPLTAAIVQSEDYYPTLLSGLGLKPAADQRFDGASILSALKGDPLLGKAVFQYFPHNPGVPDWLPPSVSVHRGDWKLIRIFNGGEKGAHRYLLFNVRDDLSEKTNLAAQKPALVAELDALIEKFLVDTRAVVPVANSAFDPAKYHPELEGKQTNQDKPKAKPVKEASAKSTLKDRTDAPLQLHGGATDKVEQQSEGLHGYISYGATRPPSHSEFSAGMGFYSAVWSLVDQPLAGFQIGLPGTWILPDNTDDKDHPLAPEGTQARKMADRGPTWSSVFQTVEGGMGYWRGNHFRYGPPKFSMNATPQCYDYEIGSPGWSFFYDNEALPDNRLGVAQLSNRLLIPPDALPFQGNPNGQFLGYTWLALPFTDATAGDPPTGDQSWTCFLSAANFKGPIAYYIPETWSKIGKLFNDPYLYGRGLDARPGVMGGGAMEINTVPRLEAKDSNGTAYAKIPKLRFPVDAKGRTVLVQDVTFYSKAALYDDFKRWRDSGTACSGRFAAKGSWKSTLSTRTPRYTQAGKGIHGVKNAFDTKVFDGNVWGLQWNDSPLSPKGVFPQYYREVDDKRIAVSPADVPADTRLQERQFRLAKPGVPYPSPTTIAWSKPGPKTGPLTARLADGSVVTYVWYRFVDQPSFQQYAWSTDKKAALQALVEKIHMSWSINRDYMDPPSQGSLVALDQALLVTPPKGLEVGYVPIVVRQAAR